MPADGQASAIVSIQRSLLIARLDRIVRLLPATALVLCMVVGFAGWLGSIPETFLLLGRGTVEHTPAIRAVQVMAHGPPAGGVLGKVQTGIPPSRRMLADATGLSLLVCAVIAAIHCLLSLVVLSRTYVDRPGPGRERSRLLYSRLYASVDTAFPFAPKELAKLHALTAGGSPGALTAISAIGSAIPGAQSKRLIVLCAGGALWAFWPFDDFGMLSRPLSMFLGYPLFNWAAVFGVSELLFLFLSAVSVRIHRQRE